MRLPGSLLLALALVGCGPLVSIPGGELSGDLAPTPTDWAFTDAVSTVQLETRPSDPYSVNVWAVAAEGALYIAAGSGAESAWAGHIQADPRVRLRVEESIYELKAVRTEEEADRTAFLEAAKRKYDFDPAGEDTESAFLFRLVPR
jgi:hypothetical protein